jgi:hypothetical protein
VASAATKAATTKPASTTITLGPYGCGRVGHGDRGRPTCRGSFQHFFDGLTLGLGDQFGTQIFLQRLVGAGRALFEHGQGRVR